MGTTTEELKKLYSKLGGKDSNIPKASTPGEVLNGINELDLHGGFSGDYNDLTNKPPLGTASPKDVAASGDASSSQVVMGNDSRLTDRRGSTWGQINGTLANQTDLKNELDDIDNRIDSIIALPDGSTTADAELVDIRNGVHGQTFNSAGDAVRASAEQLYNMKTGFDGVEYPTPAAMVQGCDEKIMNSILKNEDGFLHKGYLTAQNQIQYDASLQSIITDPIPVVEGDMFLYTGYAVTNAVSYIMFDSNGAIVSTYKKNFLKEYIVTIPAGVATIRFAHLFTSTHPEYYFSLKRIAKYEKQNDLVLGTYTNRVNFGYYSISDNVAADNTINAVYTEKITCTPGEQFLYTGKSGSNAPMCIFYNDNSVVKYLANPTGYHFAEIITIPDGVNYVRFCSYDLHDRIAKLNVERKTGLISILDIKMQTEFYENSGYLTADGSYQNAGTFDSKTTTKIPCVEGDQFLYTGKSVNYAVEYIMYNDSTIVSTKTSTGMTYNDLVTIPSGVNYIKFSSFNTKGLDVTLFVEKHPFTGVVHNGLKCQNLIGKKINVLGDSYVANNGQPVSNTWHYKMAAAFSMTYRNYGINGNGMVSGTNPMSERYANMDNDADYILVIGGTNDFNYQTEIATFKSSLGTFIENLVAKYPTGKIVFFTIWNSLEQLSPAYVGTKTIEIKEYNDAIIEMCNKYSIPVYDAWRKSGMRAWDGAFRTAFFQSSTDHAHLNNAGHDRFLPEGETFMDSVG